MKPIEKDELFNHLNGFLKTRGIELTDGSYSNGIQKTCSLLADAINVGQQGYERAKTELDKRLEQMRQVIHKKTAPKSAPSAQATPPSTAAASTPAAATAQRASAGTARKKRPSKTAKRSKSRRHR